MSYVNIERAKKIIPKICEKNTSLRNKLYNKIKAHSLISDIDKKIANDFESLIKTSQIRKSAVQSGNSLNKSYESPKKVKNIFKNYYYYLNNNEIHGESKKLKNSISTPIYNEIKKLNRSLIISDETQKKLQLKKIEVKENNSINDSSYYKKLLKTNKSSIDKYFNESINNINEDISYYLEKMHNLCRNYRNLQNTTKNIKIRNSLLSNDKILKNKKKIQSPLKNCDLLYYKKSEVNNKKHKDEVKTSFNMKLLKEKPVSIFLKKNNILDNEPISNKKYDNTAQVVLFKVLKNRNLSAIMLKKKNELDNLINDGDLPEVDEYEKIIQNVKKQNFIKKINKQKNKENKLSSTENLLRKFDYNLRYHTKTTIKDIINDMNKLIFEVKNELKLKKEQNEKMNMEKFLNYYSVIKDNNIINESLFTNSMCNNNNNIFCTQIKASKEDECGKKNSETYRNPFSKFYRLNSKMSKNLTAKNYEEYLLNNK